jgi:hypothetical protein
VSHSRAAGGMTAAEVPVAVAPEVAVVGDDETV